MLLGDDGADLWRTFPSATVMGTNLTSKSAYFAFRHNKSSGCAFADGHAGMVKLEDVPAQRPDAAGGLTEFWRSE